MSSLWTPGGEHPVEPDAASSASSAPAEPTGDVDPLAGLSSEERAQAQAMAEEMADARRRVLEALDLEVDAGQTLVLLGRSGSGKQAEQQPQPAARSADQVPHKLFHMHPPCGLDHAQ